MNEIIKKFYNKSLDIIVENGYNTSYLSCTLLALFFCPSILPDILLNAIPKKIHMLYLQELIKEYIINNLQSNKVISSPNLNEIRNYMFMCGWGKSNLVGLFSPIDLIKFLFEEISDYEITFEKAESNVVNFLSFNLINIVPDGSNLSDLLKLWISNNIVTSPTTKYKFSDVPLVLIFAIDRSNDNTIDIDIMYNIKWHNIDDIYQKTITWSIRSIICYDYNSNYYYSIVRKNKNWFLINDHYIPSIFSIDVTDILISTKVKKESVLAIYVSNI